MKTRVLELNASDERGINVVRDKIKSFAAAAVGQAVPGYPCPPYKLLILDEADSMTPVSCSPLPPKSSPGPLRFASLAPPPVQDAQNALRRTMETYSKVTRFCFICNYVSRIIEPLASRCAKFRFKPLHEAIMSSRVLDICRAEQVDLGPGAMGALSQVSGGDLRKAITTLQSAVRLKGTPVAADTVVEVSGVVPGARIGDLWQACLQGKPGKRARARRSGPTHPPNHCRPVRGR